MLETRLYPSDPDTLFAQAQRALQSIGASQIETDSEQRRLDAVFRVVFFKDDVAVLVGSGERGTALHIRSASRVGSSDFGVNKRRVRRFFAALERQPPAN